MTEPEKNFYLTPLQLRAHDDELVINIVNDIQYLSNLVNECSEITGVTSHPLPFSTHGETLRATFFVEVADSGGDDYERIRAVFEQAFVIGELESRFHIIEGVKRGASNN